MGKIEPRLFDELRLILSSFGDKYFIDDELNRSKVAEDLRNYDEALLSKLFKSIFIKQHFFKQIAGEKLFQIELLENAILYNNYWETSYTKYENRIGITSGGKYIQDSQDVVLDFPFKDGLLTASMTSEENEESYDNAFFNEIIEKSEIDSLLSEKIMINIKKYGSLDDEAADYIDMNFHNLIIKGNNLLALYSLRKKYSGRIKSIIIDPPYYFRIKGKGADSFPYNSSFKLSTWLVFMKNRLTIAKELLAEDGVLSIIIGTDGSDYLKIIADEIFNVQTFPKNFIGKITWRKTDNQSNVGIFANVSDYILLYRKNPSTQLGKLPLSEKAKKEYSYSDTIGYYRRANILDYTRGKYTYEIRTPDGSVLNGPWMITEEEFNLLESKGEIHWPSKGSQIPYGKTYLKDSLEKGQITSDFWDSSYGTNQRSADEIKGLFGSRAFEYAKPEKLIQNIISLTSSENDVVMDFFLGSGTTAAVAHKMNRRYIGIEQMDYIETITVERLKKVIEGEQGGISKDVSWQGGGSFVYAELFPKNMGYLQDIIHSQNIDELRNVYERMLDGTDSSEPADISFRADLSKIDWSRGFDDNKRILIKLLDKNGLYYNYSEIDDVNVRDLISDNDYAFNKQFYEGGE
ncbi:DNA methyltransferase [Enterococcus cecorum]|uniref:DNA methyltransferase n=1 Tax=Enterococcus cecorum TaxID=44008 RepID=UPI0006434940|nr:site-specific DNA-methyltransferase [Enterococcus cecorum]KLO67420.1 hypothetical protein AA986_03655 [Enterococcus cecorum]CAI3313948.1 site-specific DNA-methyltransferase [Enterococcus cecorum]CAI3324599.1 site-specific DNA-methyltransferase [Enterococcus cecorum]CAI3348599.1 site-specific DNA-methyltransferase [Enterococcus cecorum]CAI3356642.1 site-specific DNA-methyltransferase [Enterococcus cecorum]